MSTKKVIYVAATVVLMLIASRFAVRLVDATVQIDDDLVVLAAFVALLNAVIAGASWALYRRIYANPNK
jgi:hypothetical protein